RIVTGESDHPEVRDQRGERVVRDLGRRPRDRADERALAGVGESEDADIRQHLELETHVFAVTRLARLRPAWSAVVRRGEMHVDATTLAAVGHNLALTGLGDV